MEFVAPAPENAQPLSAQQIAQRVGAVVEGDPQVQLAAVQGLATAQTGSLSFWLGKGAVEACAASAVLLPMEVACPPALTEIPARLRVARPDLAAALIAQHFDLARPRWVGVHERAVIDPRAELAEGCTVHAGAWIGPDCVLGAGTTIHANAVLQSGSRLGPGCTVHSNTVIGADGFGYVWSGERHEKVPQQGWVEIGAGVEIGSCTTIDRGTFGPTRIGDGCIIDNQVQIGHNCELGRFVVLCAQVGLSGSTEVGDGAVLGGRAATVGHVRVGAGVRMAGSAVATKDIPDGLTVGGYPAWDLALERKLIARTRRTVK